MRLYLREPSKSQLNALIQNSSAQNVTHRNVGSTLEWERQVFTQVPEGRVQDDDMILTRATVIGDGMSAYDRAACAIKEGACFNLDWVRCYMTGELKEGSTFCLYARAFGVWIVSLCRVVYVQESRLSNGNMFSLGVGTLPSHVARGEERLSIVWDRESDDVEFLIGSFSRPQTWLTRIFAFYLRRQQNRFALDATCKLRDTAMQASDLVQASVVENF